MPLLSSRDVIVIRDPYTRPRKPKWLICVNPRHPSFPHRSLFLRINSQPLWKPHQRLWQADNPFLKHDSFVELTEMVVIHMDDVDDALRNPANRLGRLSDGVATDLASAAQNARTLPEEHKRIIWEGLVAIWEMR
jgi:hypothetical protein